MSIAAVGAMVWLVREKPRLTLGQVSTVCWLVGGFVVFGVFGKGVARYLTPVWPAVAMVGALWLSRFVASRSVVLAARLRVVMVLVFVLMSVGQVWWYASGRVVLYGDRCPRAFLREVLPQIDVDRLGTYEIASPAIEYYVGKKVPVWVGPSSRRRDGAGTAADLVALVRGENSPYVLILREESPDVVERWGSVLGELGDAGVRIEPIEMSAAFSTRNRDGRVIAVRLGGGES